MKYTKRYRVQHTFDNGSRFIGTIVMDADDPRKFPDKLNGNMSIKSENGRFQGRYQLDNGLAGIIFGSVMPPEVKDWMTREGGFSEWVVNEFSSVNLPTTTLPVEPNRNPSFDSVKALG